VIGPILSERNKGDREKGRTRATSTKTPKGGIEKRKRLRKMRKPYCLPPMGRGYSIRDDDKGASRVRALPRSNQRDENEPIKNTRIDQEKGPSNIG